MKGKPVTSGVGLMNYRARFYIVVIIAFAISAPQLLPAARAQAPTAHNNGTLDPAEARILNSIFQKWGIQANNQQWNLSGELCTGFAVDSTSMQDTAYNPGIKCDCSSTPCRITSMKVYALDVTGVIPDELWNLTSLIDLDLGQNYLTGTLSPSIGNLRGMQYLSLGINALSGELPKELELLTEIRSFAIGSNNFSGPLPSGLGNWKSLTQIYMDASGVSGAIPPTFANLLNLEILRISDLLNGSSSLDFIWNMKNLSKLVLRNNNISGSIPSNIGEYQSLSLLDLSFNNLTGRVPDQLFNLSALQNLFLGSNKLTGSLPAQKSQNLLNIDLSYNEISGNFPSWIGGRGLQLNLISNNFTIDRSNGSALPSGLNCLQKNFPCNRGNPIYSSFAIKCGGQEITSSNQIVYERDNATLGPATYYMTSTGRWAGNLKEKDFDIKKLAGGSLRALSRQYKVQVSENHMDIHLYWAGKGTCCIPSQGTYGPLISAISATPDFVPTVSNRPPSEQKKNRTGMVVGIVVAVGIVSFLSVFAVYCFVQRRKRQETYDDEEMETCRAENEVFRAENGDVSRLSDFLGMDVKPYTFSYAVLKAGTSDFSPSNKLGEGGFGSVYKGTLEDGRNVAVKQLSVASHQGKSQFLAEIATISGVQHRNLVKLYGCCYEGNKRLLAWHLHENNRDVDVVDERLSDFNKDEVKRVIGVSLLCTQASPSMRPSMSRVVAMLSGDTEVPTVTSRPSYLTDWKFDDRTSFMTDIHGSQTAGDYSSVATTTSVTTSDLNSSPLDASGPMLREIIREGR
nr:probable LRR receptor-like serine/threonine-protein kinase At1g56140 isoform X1 [Ipomoea batatas]